MNKSIYVFLILLSLCNLRAMNSSTSSDQCIEAQSIEASLLNDLITNLETIAVDKTDTSVLANCINLVYWSDFVLEDITSIKHVALRHYYISNNPANAFVWVLGFINKPIAVTAGIPFIIYFINYIKKEYPEYILKLTKLAIMLCVCTLLTITQKSLLNPRSVDYKFIEKLEAIKQQYYSTIDISELCQNIEEQIQKAKIRYDELDDLTVLRNIITNTSKEPVIKVKKGYYFIKTFIGCYKNSDMTGLSILNDFEDVNLENKLSTMTEYFERVYEDIFFRGLNIHRRKQQYEGKFVCRFGFENNMNFITKFFITRIHEGDYDLNEYLSFLDVSAKPYTYMFIKLIINGTTVKSQCTICSSAQELKTFLELLKQILVTETNLLNKLFNIKIELSNKLVYIK
jgi:hypothetical protein